MTDPSDSSPVPHVPADALVRLARHGWTVVENYLPASLRNELREDVASLRAEGRFRVSDVGRDGLESRNGNGDGDGDAGHLSFREVRRSETCALGAGRRDSDDDVPSLPPRAARDVGLRDAVAALRGDLSGPPTTEGVATRGLAPLDGDLVETAYAYYPVGGRYARHRDAEAGSASNWRRYSFLIYLNDARWSPADGGALRLHRDVGDDELPPGDLANFFDVTPAGGTLVVFRSDAVPHEVRPTNAERCAVVGWFLGATTTNDGTSALSRPEPFRVEALPEETLASLRSLRETVPGLRQRLEPAPPVAVDDGGLWGDFDLGAAMGTPAAVPETTTKPKYPDTDSRYWSPIAAFDEEGCVVTLSLGGRRLRKLKNLGDDHPSLFRKLVVLDLANTDLPLEATRRVLDLCRKHRDDDNDDDDGASSAASTSSSLVRLHLGGNALGDRGVAALANHLPASVETLDLRYNDVGTDGASALSSFLVRSRTERLHLEGNRLGDEGVARLSRLAGGRLRELYVGQNDVGPDGASALADHALGRASRLEKLYLEGNRIGDAGARCLRSALESIDPSERRLSKLYADNNGLGKEEALRLSQAVGSVTRIGDAAFYQDDSR